MYFTVITKGCRTKLNFVAGKCGMRPANSALTLLIMGLRPLKNAQRQSLDPPPRSLPKGCKRKPAFSVRRAKARFPSGG
jgi:hypothetical protein